MNNRNAHCYYGSDDEDKPEQEPEDDDRDYYETIID